MIILSLKELLEEMYSIELVFEALVDAKTFYIDTMSNSMCEKNRVYSNSIDNINKSIEMCYKHNPGFDAISNILYAIDCWNYSGTNFVEGYFRKRKALGDALCASCYGVLDMYNCDNYYLKSFVRVLEDYSNNIEDFDKILYNDTEDMTMIKNFNKVDELDLEKAQNISKILSITNRLYKYYDESLKMLP